MNLSIEMRKEGKEKKEIKLLYKHDMGMMSLKFFLLIKINT